jgi:hypothetical protein
MQEKLDDIDIKKENGSHHIRNTSERDLDGKTERSPDSFIEFFLSKLVAFCQARWAAILVNLKAATTCLTS